ncbi:MAG: hypothetical protein AMXMBFR33_36430 [Candidatus Xenobia bacterium]
MGLTDDLCLIFVAAVVGGLIARAVRAPLVLGYILAGLLVSPHTPGPKVLELEQIDDLAEMGVALLMFGIGLEFSLSRLSDLKKVALYGTALQMALTALVGMLLIRLLEYSWTEGLWVGAALSLSSTMVALKVLQAQGYQDALSGRIMLAMLVVQDLAIIPIMILLPQLGDLTSGMWSVLRLLVRGTLMIGVVWLLGRKLLPRLFTLVASHSPRELFTLLVVAVGLGVGYASYVAGLSFAFGAFLAGLVLSESDYSHHVLNEVGPLRDLFGMLFFVSVGLLINPQVVVENLDIILALVLFTILAKAFIFAWVTRLFGYRNIVPFAVGLTLCQIGEFSFVLAQVGQRTGNLSTELYNLVMVTAVLTMVVTPATSSTAPRVRRIWSRWFPPRHPSHAQDESLTPEGLAGHVLIGGYGRVGRVLAHALSKAGVPFLAVDPNPNVVLRARAAGHPILLGDLSADTILEVAQAQKARLVMLTLTDPVASVRSAESIRKLRPEIPVLARAVSNQHRLDLLAHGARMALWPELETGLELTRRGLITLELESDADELRSELEEGAE